MRVGENHYIFLQCTHATLPTQLRNYKCFGLIGYFNNAFNGIKL